MEPARLSRLEAQGNVRTERSMMGAESRPQLREMDLWICRSRVVGRVWN
jgi:hypothetical protein